MAETLMQLRTEAATCTACELYREGTQTVFGEGSGRARLLLVGEQPGDREDREGHPFVGPAGHVLDEALAEAGIDRREVYLTNAVKHFHNEPRGKKRIHRKPELGHIRACERWLTAELALVQPELAVALGATAVRAMLGPAVRVMADRGRTFVRDDGLDVLVTIHPSAILRIREKEERQKLLNALIEDLGRARAAVA